MVLLCAGIALTGEARAQVASVPSPSSTTTEVFGPMALLPGNRLYVDMWRWYAVRTGHFVVFDGAGTMEAAWPDVDGRVDAIAADGAGGWFIGGAFTHVGGQRREGLAHILAGGALDAAWVPGVEGTARALAVVDATVYAAGELGFMTSSRSRAPSTAPGSSGTPRHDRQGSPG
jgi:hypothetical protein